MIKVLILYYLSLKPTHGYEIQKFIQVNHMDSWTKIQSGSIYYALAKLAAQGLISPAEEVTVGAKVRKVYHITDKGREELRELVRLELGRPICETGSDKFILYPLLSVSDKDEIEREIFSHIKALQKKRDNIKKWQSIKVNERTLEVEKISFEMMISGLDYQIKWHEALVLQLSACILQSEEVANIIKVYDFSNSEIADSATDLESLKKKTLR